jgi:hypothetical protein
MSNKPQKPILMKLPDNFDEMTEEQIREWAGEISKQIISDNKNSQ